ncbi:MAG: three component ABC system middle component [Pseudomonadota bacterium]|nr:three component ABC system middle component [Pseudomonadota bacterium]
MVNKKLKYGQDPYNGIVSDYYNIPLSSSLILNCLYHYFDENNKPLDLSLVYYILPISFIDTLRSAFSKTTKKSSFTRCAVKISSLEDPLGYIGHQAVCYKRLSSLSLAFLIENKLIQMNENATVISLTSEGLRVVEELERTRKKSKRLIDDRYQASKNIGVKFQQEESEQRIVMLTKVST